MRLYMNVPIYKSHVVQQLPATKYKGIPIFQCKWYWFRLDTVIKIVFVNRMRDSVIQLSEGSITEY
jgi:hypothetical protein